MIFGDLPRFRGAKPWIDISARQMNNLVDTVKALATVKAGPGIDIRLNKSGFYIGARPQKKVKRVSAIAASRFGVVREAVDDDSLFVTVQAVQRDDAEPWVGGYEFEGDSTPVACWPGLHAKDYQHFVWSGDTPTPPATHVLPVLKIGADWYIQQYRIYSHYDVTGLAISDCQLPPEG